MNAIGFKNFRNFVDFPTMPTNGVTILVGSNNAGKSTCTKAYRLLAQNLYKFINDGMMIFNEYKMQEEPRKIDLSSVCGNFERALSTLAEDDVITIKTQIGYFDINLQMTTKNKKDVFVPLTSIEIKDTLDGCSWSWTNERSSNNKSNSISTFRYTSKTLVNLLRLEEIEIKQSIQRVRYILQRESTKNDTRKKAENKLILLEKALTSNKAAQDKYEKLNSTKPFICYDWIPFDLQNYKIILDGDNTDIIQTDFDDDEFIGGEWKPKGYAKLFSDFFKRIREDLKRACRNEQIEYFRAYESPLDSYFSINHNETDSNAFDICQFYRYDKDGHTDCKNWVRRKMKELGIGEDFDIDDTKNSDFLYVTITNSKGDKIPLADNGRGAVQLFMMLIRLAKFSPSTFEEIYDSYREDMIDDDDNYFPDGAKRKRSITKLIIFEEPEQNLHPKLQSKLADLFMEVSKLGVNVLVETHSEYLVRRSQVLVAEAKYKDEQELAQECPFKVYYFPEIGSGEPYEMEFMPTGGFKNSFGEGFFDEAGKLDMIVLRNESSLKRR